YPIRQSSCYNPTQGIGFYPCLEVPMGVLIRTKEGKEASVCCTDYKFDGSIVDNIKNDFGTYSKQGFRALQTSLKDFTLSSSQGLDQNIVEKLKDFVSVLNNFKSNLDLENSPEKIYDYNAAMALY